MSAPPKYLSKQDTYIVEVNDEIKDISQKLWTLYYEPSFFYIKHHVAELVHLLLEKQPHKAKTCTFFTNTQTDLAKKAESILTADLSKHISIKDLAKELSVGETSLKRYFKGVYHKNISGYLRDRRMHAAVELLTTTKLHVFEIAQQVGYSNQGKFASVFKKHYGMNPLEYRRTKSIERIGT